MSYFGKQNPTQTNYSEDKEKMAQMDYFAPFMEMVKNSSDIKNDPIADKSIQSSGGKEISKPVDSMKETSSSSESKNSRGSMADVGGAAIKGIGSVLTGIGTEAIKRESEERMAAAKAKSDVLAGKSRISSGIARSKSDILSKLAAVLPIVRR